MTFKEKNITVTFASFSVILLFFLFRVLQMISTENFTEENVIRLWIITIILGIFVTIVGTILTHIFSAVIEAISTGNEEPEIEDLEDERDRLIDLKGTKITYAISALGTFLSMLTFALGQPPLIMFTLLIFFGVLAQVLGDISRLAYYRGGV